MTALLRVQGLARRPFFEPHDLELARGEVVFLRGPSGSGKSLFLRCIADLDPADEGTVTLDGRASTTLAPDRWRRQVLHLRQTPARPPGTVADDLARIAALAQRPATEPDAALDELGLGDAQAVDTLSGGEAQLLALARAFVTGPLVYLLDEATVHLDEDAAARAERALAARLAEGAACLWVSHDRGLAERLGARVEAFA